jgi:hypothetical protein
MKYANSKNSVTRTSKMLRGASERQEVRCSQTSISCAVRLSNDTLSITSKGHVFCSSKIGTACRWADVLSEVIHVGWTPLRGDCRTMELLAIIQIPTLR